MTARDFQDYQSTYLNLYADFRSAAAADKETINDDVVFEIELIKQIEVNVDYILMLVEQYLKAKGMGNDKEIRATIDRAVAASPSLRNKKDLIEQFVDSVLITTKVDAAWLAFIVARKAEELDRIITDEQLDGEATRKFVENAFRDGAISDGGTAISSIFPPMSRFAADAAHSAKKRAVRDRLRAFFDRYFWPRESAFNRRITRRLGPSLGRPATRNRRLKTRARPSKPQHEQYRSCALRAQSDPQQFLYTLLTMLSRHANAENDLTTSQLPSGTQIDAVTLSLSKRAFHEALFPRAHLSLIWSSIRRTLPSKRMRDRGARQ